MRFAKAVFTLTIFISTFSISFQANAEKEPEITDTTIYFSKYQSGNKMNFNILFGQVDPQSCFSSLKTYQSGTHKRFPLERLKTEDIRCRALNAAKDRVHSSGPCQEREFEIEGVTLTKQCTCEVQVNYFKSGTSITKHEIRPATECGLK
jgi:hypothetical protein